MYPATEVHYLDVILRIVGKSNRIWMERTFLVLTTKLWRGVLSKPFRL